MQKSSSRGGARPSSGPRRKGPSPARPSRGRSGFASVRKPLAHSSGTSSGTRKPSARSFGAPSGTRKPSVRSFAAPSGTRNRTIEAPKFSPNIAFFTAGKPDAGKPLQDFLAARLGLSRRAAKAIVDGRHVWVNRKCVWIAHHPLKNGDMVELPRSVAAAARRQTGSAREAAPEAAERSHVRVLLQTEHYVVADKPAGILTCEDPHSAETILREQLKEPSLQAVHRLDRDTTGCLLFAKSYEAKLAAIEIFKTRRVVKIYQTITAGRFTHAHETIDTPLDGQPAVTRVSRESTSDDASFLRVKIETGRTNQIRRHLASIGCPVVGDRVFGLKSARDVRLMTVPRQMLHAATLELPDPMNLRETIKAHSPLPADFRGALKLFGMGKR